jgi:hypothetical protein
LKLTVAPPVSGTALCMVSTVDFNNETPSGRREVGNEVSDNVLPPKADAELTT